MHELQILNAVDSRDAIFWDGCIDALPLHRRDIHFTSAYGRVQEKNGGEAILVYMPRTSMIDSSNRDFIIQPFIKRPTPYDSTKFDLCSLYGYGGPMSNMDEVPEALARIWAAHLSDWCNANNVVSEFCYLHPLFMNHQFSILRCQAIINRKDVIIIDLETMSEHTVARRVRRGCRKARAQGVKVKTGYGGHKTFFELYERSMDLKDAASRWRFSEEYIKAHYIEPDLRARLFFVSNGVGERMLMTIGNYGTAYAHLLGSNGEATHSGLDELLYCETAVHLREHGYKYFVLGGGTTSLPGDKLLAFKSGFSPDRWKLASYQRVFDYGAYADLNTAKLADEMKAIGRPSTSSRFPEYRRDTI